MSNELQQLAGAVNDLSQRQQQDRRRIKNVEQAFVQVTELLLRQDELNDDWRAWRLEAEEHRRNTDAHISVLGELLVENAQRTTDNSQAIAELRQSAAENNQAIGALGRRLDQLTATVEKLAERNGNGTA